MHVEEVIIGWHRKDGFGGFGGGLRDDVGVEHGVEVFARPAFAVLVLN